MSNCGTMEVYVCKMNGEIVYVGKGKKGRHKHCNSGTSHVFELNKIYFTEGSDVLDVIVVKYFQTDEEARKYEKLLISKYSPKFNKALTSNCNKASTSSESLKMRREIKAYIKDKEVKKLGDNYSKYYKLVDEFLDHFGYTFVKSKDFILYGAMFYRGMNLKFLASLSRFIRGDGDYCERSHVNVFYNCIKDLYAVDLKDHLS